MKKNNIQLINNIIGQLAGVKEMLTKNEECFNVLTQMKAAKSGLNSVINKYLEENFAACLNNKNKGNNTSELCHQFFKEILKNN